MASSVRLDDVFSPSQDIVCRNIEGELILVPIVAGMGDLEDVLFSLNDTGKAVWNMLDGRTSVENIVRQLTDRYSGAPSNILQDVLDLIESLLERRLVIRCKGHP